MCYFFSYQSTTTTAATNKSEQDDLFSGVGIDFGQTQNNSTFPTTSNPTATIDDNLFDPFAELSTNRQQQSSTVNINKTQNPAAISFDAFNISPTPTSHQTSKQIPVLSKPPGDSNSSLFAMTPNNSSANQQFSTNSSLINSSTATFKSQPMQQNSSDDLFSGLSETVAPKQQQQQQQNNSGFDQFDLLSIGNTSSAMNPPFQNSTSNQQILSQPNISSSQINMQQQQQQNSGFGFFQQNSSSGIDSLDSVPRTVSSTPASSNNIMTATSLIPQQNSGLDNLLDGFSSATSKSNTPMNTLLNQNTNSSSQSFMSGSQQKTLNFAQNTNIQSQNQQGFSSQNKMPANSNIQTFSGMHNMAPMAPTTGGGYKATQQGSYQQRGVGGSNINSFNTISYSNNSQGFATNQQFSGGGSSINMNTNNYQPQQNMNSNMNQQRLTNHLQQQQQQQQQNYRQQQQFQYPQQQYQQQQGMQSNLNFINPSMMNNQQQQQRQQPLNRGADAFSFVQDAMKSSGNKK